jgi:hypothetical protein
MQSYEIRDYQKGFEADQSKIGQEVARNWIWPYAYNLEDLLKLHAQPDFDPGTRHYCFVNDRMVGYMFSIIQPAREGKAVTASLDFPRLLPGHEGAARLLLEKAFEILKGKGVAKVTGRVTTMVPRDIRLAEESGFTIHNWGYKVYYSYEMAWGRLAGSDKVAREIDPGQDLDDCAELASRWYNRPAPWCRTLLAEWHQAGIITHTGVRRKGKLVAACMVAPNDVRPTAAAIYYIYTPDESDLKPMLVRVVNHCIDFGVDYVIADLINEHRRYEPLYQALGFRKVADWAQCDIDLV